jgi:hypothetical protein
MDCEDSGGGAGGVGEFPGGGDPEQAEQLGKELDKSLGEFDESLGEEQREISSATRNTEGFDTGSGGNRGGSISLAAAEAAPAVTRQVKSVAAKRWPAWTSRRSQNVHLMISRPSSMMISLPSSSARRRWQKKIPNCVSASGTNTASTRACRENDHEPC